MNRPVSQVTPRPKPRRRPISASSPLVGRQLWRIGDWGGASEQIGRRWETLGARALGELLGAPRPAPGEATYVPTRAVVLATDPEISAQVHASGKPHADAILVGEANGRAVLEPVDFKWTLETADPKQVGADVLGALLDGAPPLLERRLAEALAGLPESEAPLFYDGIFLAPDHAENRAFLAPRGPLDPSWTHLTPVAADEFFPPLTGWDVAEALAATDRFRLDRVETADRYYRIGAGVLGALRKIEAGIFQEEPADLDGPEEMAKLRRERGLRTVGELVAFLDRALIGRAEMLERLRDVERSSYPFGLFRQDLVARGLASGGSARDRKWGRVYGMVMKPIGDGLRAEGRALVQAGRTEAEAVAELESGRARWTSLARQALDREAGA